MAVKPVYVVQAFETQRKRLVSSKKQEPPEQSRRFMEAARELECDDSEERFREVAGKRAPAPPAPGPSKSRGVKTARKDVK
jgi:hypothetical protein